MEVSLSEDFSRRALNLGPFFERAGQVTLKSVRRNFDEGGRPRWRPLKDKSGRAPLVKTGTLRGSIQAELYGRGVRVGTALPYAAWHQEGTRHLPKRPFLMFQDEDVREIESALKDYLEGGVW